MKNNPLAAILIAGVLLVGCSPKIATTRVYTYDAKAKTLTPVTPADLSLAAKEGFSVKVINHNPFAEVLSMTTTNSTFFIDNTSPILKYVTLDAQTGAAATAAGAAPGGGGVPKGNQASPVQIAALGHLVSEIDDSGDRLKKSIEHLSGFYNALAILESFHSEWKTRDVDQAEVDAQFSKVRSALAASVSSFYGVNTAYIDPFTPSLVKDALGVEIIPTSMIVDFPNKAIVIFREELLKQQQLQAEIDQFAVANKAKVDHAYANLAVPLDKTLYRTRNINLLKGFQKFSDNYDLVIGNNLTGLGATFSTVKNVKFEEVLGPLTMTKEDEMVVKISQINILTKVDKLKDFKGLTLSRRGLKIDFSAGIFGSGLHDRSFVASQFTQITMDSVVNDGVVSVKPNSTTFSKIQQRKGDKFSYGPMAFIHFYYKNSEPVNFGGFIGTGLLFKDDARPMLSFGGNALFGKDQRYVLGIGAGISSVKRLSSKYEVGKSYRETVTEVPTENQTSVKWMFSFSWNISTAK